jgi:hypothetical protein
MHIWLYGGRWSTDREGRNRYEFHRLSRARTRGGKRDGDLEVSKFVPIPTSI